MAEELDSARAKVILDRLGELAVERADSYQKAHDQMKYRAMQIYYAFVGQFLENEEPEEDWNSRLYPKMMKPKIMAAWSQFVQAATGAKQMWNAEVHGSENPVSSARAKAMLSLMHEQADMCEMQRKLKTGALDVFLYGSLFWQAPIVEVKTKQSWEKDVSTLGKMLLAGMGRPIWKPVFEEQDSPSCIHRNYFEMYPWPYSANPQEGEAIIHRPFIDKYELSNLMDMPGFNKEVIKELLASPPSKPPSWSRESDMMAARGWQETDSRRSGYDLIFMAGRVDNKDLQGLQGFDNESGRYSEVLLHVINHSIGKKVLKIKANSIVGQHRPFMVSHYEQMPFESLGIGIGENSIDISKAIGGAVRLFLDGKKMSLPMLGINTSYFSGSTEVEFKPFKIWPFDDNRNTKPSDVMFPMQFADVTMGMVEFIEILERLHDEITGIPKWTTGVDSKMLNKTATGISMIMNASSQLIRGAIENLDDFIITPTGQRFYDWNMANPKCDPRIKENLIISAAGISSLMQKETLNQQMMGLLSLVINPQVMQNPFALRLLRMVGDGMGIKDVDSILPNPDKMQEFADQDPRSAARSLQPSQPPTPTVPEMMRQAQIQGAMEGMKDRAKQAVIGSPSAPGSGGEGSQVNA